MLRRTFLVACASLVLFKETIKKNCLGIIKIYKNKKLIYEGNNEIKEDGFLCYVEFKGPIEYKNDDTLRITKMD